MQVSLLLWCLVISVVMLSSQTVFPRAKQVKISWWEVRTEGWVHQHSPSKFYDDLSGQHIGVWPSVIEEKNFYFSCGTTCLYWWTGHGIIHFMLWKDHCISVYQPGRHCQTLQQYKGDNFLIYMNFCSPHFSLKSFTLSKNTVINIYVTHSLSKCLRIWVEFSPSATNSMITDHCCKNM